MRGAWNAHALKLEIRDDGPGIASRILERLGHDLVSTKGEGGLGIGLYLANTVLARLGGRVEFLRPSGGGTHVRIEIPLAGMTAGSIAAR